MSQAADIARRITDIQAAAFGMGHEPNAGQAARIAALQAELEAQPQEAISAAYVEGTIPRPLYIATIVAMHTKRLAKGHKCVCLACREVRGQ